MTTGIRDPEVFGLTESTVTIAYHSTPDAGSCEILLDDRVQTTHFTPGAHLHRIDGLDANRNYRLRIRPERGREAPYDRYFPEIVQTLPAPDAEEVATFATLNDVHFGEPRVGGQLDKDMEYGEEDLPDFPLVRADEEAEPYWHYMNVDAIAEINAAECDLAIIKGDIANNGEQWQFEAAREAFAGFSMPHHAFLGNHDYFARRRGESIDGYALLGQPAAPRIVELAGWRLILLETSIPGSDSGAFGVERRDWLANQLDRTAHDGSPTLLLMHHQPVPHSHAHVFPNTIGIDPADSHALFSLLGQHPQVRGVLIGHTHRNRVHRYEETGALPFIEVQCSKDYPGGWARYRLFADGSFRQEVRRTSTERALRHSSRCSSLFRGGYRAFALGKLHERSFAVAPQEP